MTKTTKPMPDKYLVECSFCKIDLTIGSDFILNSSPGEFCGYRCKELYKEKKRKLNIMPDKNENKM